MTLFLLACTMGAPNVATEATSRLQVDVVSDPAQARRAFENVIGSAQETLTVELPALDDTVLLDAIGAAAGRGVATEVVVDVDLGKHAGVTQLQDAGATVHLVDAGVTYFDFAIEDDVAWASTDVIMTHGTAIADGVQVANGTGVGSVESFPRVVFQAVGEDLGYDLTLEHNQLAGGTDAAALTAYSSMAKSVADMRWKYETGTDTVLEVWLGPQERLTKRIIDAIYSARASVWITTDDYGNRGLTEALQAKAADGFDVRIVVGQNFGSSLQSEAQRLVGETPDVVKAQVQTVLPTVILLDYDFARDGNRYEAQAMVLSHPLYSAERFVNNVEVRTDQLMDGNMWVLDDFAAPHSVELKVLEDFWNDTVAQGAAL